MDRMSRFHLCVEDGSWGGGRSVTRHGSDVTVPFMCRGWVVGWWRGRDEPWTGCHGSTDVWRMARGVMEER